MNKQKTIKSRIHHGQKKFFGDVSRIRWIFGGNRTGKTTAGAMEAVKLALKKKNTEGWVVSLSSQVQRDVAQRTILEQLEKKGLRDKIECVMHLGHRGMPERGIIDFLILPNESRIGFKNCEQGRDKFQGVKLDWVWFDEEPSEDIFDECLMRVMDKKGKVWGTMTPLKGKSWVYERIYKSDEISVHKWSWEDNPYLDRREIKQMEKNFSKETLQSRKFGEFGAGAGLVFNEFSDANIVSVGARNYIETGISIDPGYTNPTAVLWFGVDSEENIFVIDEFKESGQTVESLANMIYRKSKELGVSVDNVFIDSAATSRTLGEPKSVVEQFRNFGVNVNPMVEKNVLEGIHKLKGMFCSSGGERKLFVYEGCVALIKELRGYVWGEGEKPIKQNDHCIDALRYFVMSRKLGGGRGVLETGRNKLTKFKRGFYGK